jgi:hypothetical protein
MAINYESLREFARKNGNITLYAPTGEVTILKDGTFDLLGIIEKATAFIFEGKQYTRAQFEKLLANPTEK